MFFGLSSLLLALILVAAVSGATALGLYVGRSQRHRSENLREPFAALQAALLGMVGLVLAFGLAMAVDRYESRRAAVVAEANAIGTTYLRAQTLREPARTRSLARLKAYADTSARLAETVPSSDGAARAAADGQRLQRELWALAARSIAASPRDTAPRLYVETLNEMINAQRVHVAHSTTGSRQRCSSSRSSARPSRSACLRPTSRSSDGACWPSCLPPRS